MSNAWEAGILGFIGGAAGAKVDQINLEDKRNYEMALLQENRVYNEQLRLRKEESALLKERNLLKIREEMANEARDAQLKTDGLMDAQGNLVLDRLDPELAELANANNIRKMMDQQRLLEADRIKDRENIRFVPSDTEVATGAQLQASLEEGPRRTPGRQASPAELRAEQRAIKQAHDVAVSGATNMLATQAPRWGDSQSKKLKDIMLTDLTSEQEVGDAFRSMTINASKAKVLASYEEQLKQSGTAFKAKTANELAQEIIDESNKMSEVVLATAKATEEATLDWMEATGITGRDEVAEQVNAFISKGWKRGQGYIHPSKQLGMLGYWNPHIKNLIAYNATQVARRTKR